MTRKASAGGVAAAGETHYVQVRVEEGQLVLSQSPPLPLHLLPDEAAPRGLAGPVDAEALLLRAIGQQIAAVLWRHGEQLLSDARLEGSAGAVQLLASRGADGRQHHLRVRLGPARHLLLAIDFRSGRYLVSLPAAPHLLVGMYPHPCLRS
jgi:hypothetical protein